MAAIGEVSNIAALDEHSLRLDLAAPNTALLAILSVATTSILPIQEMEAGTFDLAKGMLGSGPSIGMASVRWPWLEQLVNGRERELVSSGQVDEAELRKGLVTHKDLQEAVRKKVGEKV